MHASQRLVAYAPRLPNAPTPSSEGAHAPERASRYTTKGNDSFPLFPQGDLMHIDPTIKMELEKVKVDVDSLLPKLGKKGIRELKGVIERHYQHRYQLKHKIPKYGSLNKGFTEPELRTFFFAVDNDKHRLLFSFMAYLGLRIGEAVAVNIHNINFETREFRLKSEKTHKLDLLIIPQALFEQTKEYAEHYKTEIANCNGYLFFKETWKAEVEPHLDSNYVRKAFREYIIRSGLDETYDISDETKGREPRQLHRLTTHSLRHYAISHFAEQTNGNLILSSKFARHLKPSTTMTYIHTDKESLYREIDRAFR